MLVYYAVGLLVVTITYLHNYRGLRPRVVGHKLDMARPEFENAQQPRVPLAALTLILVIFAGIRYEVGSDYPLYAALYKAINPNSLVDSLEIVPQELGWVTLAFVLRAFTDDPYLLFWIASLLTLLPMLVAIRRKSQDPTLAVFLYFFLGYYALSFNAVRQAISVSLLVLADSYKTESRIKWVSLSAVAVLFHSSALVALVVQLLASRWKPTWRTISFVLTSSAMAAYVLLTSGAANILAAALNPRYETYLDESGAGLGTWMMLAVRVALIAFAMSMPRTPETSKFIAYVCVSAIVLLLGTTNVIIARFEPYFGIFLVFLLPNVIVSSRGARALRWFLVAGSMAYFAFYISSFNAVLPYKVIPELLISK